MEVKDIKSTDVFIVGSGRSVLTARRGMAHAGGKITLKDLRTEDPAKVMAGYVNTGRVELDEEARLVTEKAEALAEKRREEVIAAGKKRAEAAKKKAAEKEAAEKEAAEAKKAEEDKAAEEAEAAKRPPTKAEIITAIGTLDPANPEHWTADKKPQVVTLEGVLGKQITAAARNEAWAEAQAE